MNKRKDIDKIIQTSWFHFYPAPPLIHRSFDGRFISLETKSGRILPLIQVTKYDMT